MSNNFFSKWLGDTDLAFQLVWSERLFSKVEVQNWAEINPEFQSAVFKIDFSSADTTKSVPLSIDPHHAADKRKTMGDFPDDGQNFKMSEVVKKWTVLFTCAMIAPQRRELVFAVFKITTSKTS